MIEVEMDVHTPAEYHKFHNVHVNMAIRAWDHVRFLTDGIMEEATVEEVHYSNSRPWARVFKMRLNPYPIKIYEDIYIDQVEFVSGVRVITADDIGRRVRK